MCVIIREMGELAPAKLKGDQSGESVKTKKALMQFCRKARHHRVNLLFDWQKFTDVENAIRDQSDVWCIKRYTKRLGGEDWKFFFEYIKDKRDSFFERNGRHLGQRQVIDSTWPHPSDLNEGYMYIITKNDRIILHKAWGIKHHHKEPSDSFTKITGIEFEHDSSIIAQNTINELKNTSGIDEKALHDAIFVMRSPNKGKKSQWDEILQKLIKMQESGEISWHKPFSEMKPFSLSKWFRRMEVRYKKPKKE